MYDSKRLCKKILQLRKSPNESLHHFHNHFMHFCFEFRKDEVHWSLLLGRFQYLVHISENTHDLESFEPLPNYLGVRASKSATDKVIVPSDPPSPSHQTTLVSQVEVRDIKKLSANISPYSPTPHTLNLSVGLDYESDGYDEVLSPRSPSFGPFDPLYCEFCVHLFQISLVMFMTIKCWMELVLRSQLAISFMMIMCESP